MGKRGAGKRSRQSDTDPLSRSSWRRTAVISGAAYHLPMREKRGRSDFIVRLRHLRQPALIQQLLPKRPGLSVVDVHLLRVLLSAADAWAGLSGHQRDGKVRNLLLIVIAYRMRGYGGGKNATPRAHASVRASDDGLVRVVLHRLAPCLMAPFQVAVGMEQTLCDFCTIGRRLQD